MLPTAYILLAVCLTVCVCAVDEQNRVAADQGTSTYFLSVMVMERNQTAYMQEFVRHYLEEGVDHFFIYNSHNIPHLHAELACVDAKYYTIIPRLGNGTSKTPMRQSVFEIVQPKTKWLAMVDSDDYISSRAYPGKTIREILETGMHTACDIISMPTINYAWGETKDTPVGNIRTSLTHRWGYEQQYAARYSKVGKKGSAKFADTFEKVRNRVIFEAQKVRSVGTNSATLHKRGNMCVASAQATQSCTRLPVTANNSTSNTSTDTTAAADAAGALGVNAPLPPQPLNALPKYCPEQNAYRAKRSSSYSYLVEQDIPALTLACHHYRIPSWQEWHRRARLQPHLYKDSDIAAANRQDVRDEFMLDRGTHRRYHVLQKLADAALSACNKAHDEDTHTPAGRAAELRTVRIEGKDQATTGNAATKTTGERTTSNADNKGYNIRGSSSSASTSNSGGGSTSSSVGHAASTGQQQDDAAGELGVEQESYFSHLWSIFRRWVGM